MAAPRVPLNYRLALPIFAVLLVMLCVVRLAGWWPCDVACQGGGHYQRLGGVSIVWPALVAYTCFAALAIRDARRGAWCPWLVRMGCLLGGGSLFFGWVSQRLGLHCHFCVSVHLTMFFALTCLKPLPTGMRWWDVVKWFALGFLLLNLAFHHQVVADAGPAHVDGPADDGVGRFMGAAVPASDDHAALRASDAYRAVDAGRRLGEPAARWRLELAIDPHCQTCAEEHAPLMAALKPLMGFPAAPLALVTRLVTRPSDPSGADLDRHLLAAAGLGAARFRLVLASVLGAPDGVGFAGMRGRIAEVDDPDALATALAGETAAIDQLLADDAARLRSLGALGATPQLVLIDNAAASGTGMVKRWSGRFDPAAVATEIAALIAR